MLKKNKKQIIASIIVTMLPILAGLCMWNYFPDQMPTHWNFSGEIDGWSSKGFAVFGTTGIILVTHIVCVLCTAADPKSDNVSGKMLSLVYWICPVVKKIGRKLIEWLDLYGLPEALSQ